VRDSGFGGWAIEAAQRNGKKIGICGQAPSDYPEFAEFLVKKMSGKLNGWVSYTYSRTFLKMDDSLAGQQVNNGEYYPANFDKPHNLNVILNYSFSHRYSTSFNVVYNTGRPITLPIAVFNLAGSQRIYYSEPAWVIFQASLLSDLQALKILELILQNSYILQRFLNETTLKLSFIILTETLQSILYLITHLQFIINYWANMG